MRRNNNLKIIFKMRKFEKYILENHPDPDSLLKDFDIYNQFVELAENYANEQLTLNVVGSKGCV